MQCSWCQFDNREERSFCAQCGTPLSIVCPACGFANAADETYCGGCGRVLARPARPQAAPSAAAQGASKQDARAVAGAPAGVAESDTAEPERRQITILFCDLVGSTQHASRLDPEDLRDIIRVYQKLSTAAIDRYGGFVSRYFGDGILALFGYPRAHEDHAERAVNAGLGILDEISQLNMTPGRNSPVEFAVRVGIATGTVVAGDIIGQGASEEMAVVGETPNLAARLQHLAQPNTVVVAPSTRRLAGGRFEYEDLGEQQLHGFPEAIRPWRVTGTREPESRFEATHPTALTPLADRENETDLLISEWCRAKEGSGRAMLLSGEAGIGKSRLVETLIENIGSEAYVRLRYQCSSYRTHSALYPVIAQLERAAGLARHDSPQTKLEKLKAVLALGVSAVDEVLPLFAALMSIPHEVRHSALEMSPRRQKEKTFEAILAQMRGLCRDKALLIVFEDAHWIDPTSLELLDLVMQQLAHMPALLIVTFRRDFLPSWHNQAHVTSLRLERLSAAESESLLRHMTGRKALPHEVVEQVIERTDGVPLFLEEFTKSVLESELVQEESSRYVLKGPIPSHVIPMSLQDSLVARLDQAASVKTVAQVSSAIGREFPYELLARVSQLEEGELRKALAQLIDAGLMFCRGKGPQATYGFKHVLVRDAAYDTLLRRRRRELHGHIVVTMEEWFPEMVEANPELLAHHATEAGNADKAVLYWLKAGRRASERSANAEAVSHLRRGLQEIEKLPDTPQRKRRELELLITLGPPLITAHGPGTAAGQQVYARALELCAQLPESEDHFSAHWGWWRVSMNHQSGLQRADQLLALAHKLGDTGFVLQAHHCQWATLFMLGDQSACCRHIEQGLKLYDPERHRWHAAIYGGHDARVCAEGERALALWLLGYPDSALDSVSRALSWASQLSHSASLAHARDYELMLHRYRREASTVHGKADELIAFSREQGLPDYLAKSIIFRGWAQAMMGDVEQGLDEMRTGLAELEKIGTREDFPVFFDMLAAGYLMAARADTGLAEVDKALADAETTGMRFWTAELHRFKAELLLSLSADNEVDAESQLNRALAIAREQRVRSLELRAALSLARLKQRQRRIDEARHLLLPVYQAFTEGLDTVDLKEARVLLEMV